MAVSPSDVDRSGLANAAREFTLSGHIESPTTGKAYVLDVDAQMAYEIISCTVAGADTTDPSAADIEILRNSTGVPGLDFSAVDLFAGTEVKQSATGTQTVSVGDRVTIVADTFTATPDDIFFSLLCRATRIHP